MNVVIPSFRASLDTTSDEAVLASLPEEPFILFVGALRRVKGVEVLFNAYERLEHPPPLVLLGTIESDTPQDIPAGAVALGAASYGTVIEAWDRCLFGVMPSLWPEPFGSVVHEAMARGKAVIGTFPGGHSDMIEHGKSGLLVQAGDVEALRAAMETLVTDATLRDSLGRVAATRSGDFTPETVIPRFDELYAEMAREERCRERAT